MIHETWTHPNGSAAELSREGTTVRMHLILTGPIAGSWVLAVQPALQAAFPFQWYSLDYSNGVVISNNVMIDSFGAGDYTITWQATQQSAEASTLSDLNSLLDVVDADNFVGYAASGQALPYTCIRPLLYGHEVDDMALDGQPFAWDKQISVYCAAGSVEAAHNLALSVMATLQGARVGDTTLDTSMGYTGAQVEGHYESQVTVQLHQGDIS